MADVAVQHTVEGVFEPSLFGTYSKKIGMWLFLLSDSLTFGALLFAYSYGRISTPNWPTPFGKASILNASLMTACLLSNPRSRYGSALEVYHRFDEVLRELYGAPTFRPFSLLPA